MMWRPGADHGRKHEAGNGMVTRGLDARWPITEALPGHFTGQGRFERAAAARAAGRAAPEPLDEQAPDRRQGSAGGAGRRRFSPLPEPQVLEERERDHGHRGVPVQAGDHTSAALRKYQQFYRLPVTGDFDDASREQMSAPSMRNPPSPASPPASTAASSSTASSSAF